MDHSQFRHTRRKRDSDSSRKMYDYSSIENKLFNNNGLVTSVTAGHPISIPSKNNGKTPAALYGIA